MSEVNPGPKYELIGGCWFPRPGYSCYEKVCACGSDKKVSLNLSDEDSYRYYCEDCDGPEWGDETYDYTA